MKYNLRSKKKIKQDTEVGEEEDEEVKTDEGTEPQEDV